MIICTTCQSDDIHLVATLDDGRKEVRCGGCGAVWVHGSVAPAPVTRTPYQTARDRFPSPGHVTGARSDHVARLKSEFLERHPEQEPGVAEYWSRYQRVFSAEGLNGCDPRELKDFANNATGANPGNMSVFNSAWNEMGSAEAARRTRDAVEYLLRGPDRIPLEDRLDHLIDPTNGRGMTGFRESLLTKVLCIVYPDRFLPILTYAGDGTGKRDITEQVFGLRMPQPDQVRMRAGRLAVWSNDLLVELIGDGFETMQHASAFLWWAKDQEFVGGGRGR